MVPNIMNVLAPINRQFLPDTVVSMFVRLCAEFGNFAFCNPAFFAEFLNFKDASRIRLLLKQSINEKKDVFLPEKSPINWILPRTSAKLQSCDGMLILSCMDKHHFFVHASWTYSAGVSHVNCQLRIYDSLGVATLTKTMEQDLLMIVEFLVSTILCKEVKWKPYTMIDVPTQTDGYSCGWHTCLNAFHLSRNLRPGAITFDGHENWVSNLIATALIIHSLDGCPTNPNQEDTEVTWDIGIINPKILTKNGQILANIEPNNLQTTKFPTSPRSSPHTHPLILPSPPTSPQSSPHTHSLILPSPPTSSTSTINDKPLHNRTIQQKLMLAFSQSTNKHSH